MRGVKIANCQCHLKSHMLLPTSISDSLVFFGYKYVVVVLFCLAQFNYFSLSLKCKATTLRYG